MRKRRFVLIIGCAVLQFGVAAWPAAAAEKWEPYERAFFATVERFNQALLAREQPVLVIGTKKLSFDVDAESWSRNVVRVTANPDFGVDFPLLGKGEAEPRRSRVSRAIPYEWLGAFDAPPKAVWTKERAIREATFWCEQLLGGALGPVGTPVVEFIDQPNVPKYRNGNWVVRWFRVDAAGNEFRRDNVYCVIDEKYGPSMVSRMDGTIYTEGQKVAVSEGEAISIAIPVAKALLGKLEAQRPLNNLNLDPKPKVERCIVNPNYLQNAPTPDLLTDGDQVGRLAWVVIFSVTRDRSPMPLEVWIDTETRSVLGAM